MMRWLDGQPAHPSGRRDSDVQFHCDQAYERDRDVQFHCDQAYERDRDG
jgi:hypothetical protein